MQEYEYKMVPMEEFESRRGAAAASYLEQVVGDNIGSGWEFYRIDQFIVWEKGCLYTITLGTVGQPTPMHVNVVTFRRPKG